MNVEVRKKVPDGNSEFWKAEEGNIDLQVPSLVRNLALIEESFCNLEICQLIDSA
jgi:hypothetical protein